MDPPALGSPWEGQRPHVPPLLRGSVLRARSASDAALTCSRSPYPSIRPSFERIAGDFFVGGVAR